ncbi:MAG: hypothetical protein ABII88_00205 [Candidatus Omnitrophota bacterium]
MRALNLKNRMCFKITAFIILQVFLLSSTVGAAGLDHFAVNDRAECLAPSVRLDNSLLMDVFKRASEQGTGLGVFSIESEDINTEVAEGLVNSSKQAADEGTSGPNNSGQSVNGTNSAPGQMFFGSGNPEQIEEPIWPPPQAEAIVVGNGNNFGLPYLWKKDEMIKALRAYGLACNWDEFSRMELRSLLKTLGELIEKDGTFAANLAAVKPLAVTRGSYYVNKGRKDSNQLAKIVQSKGETRLVLYKPFFYQLMFMPQNRQMKREALQQIIGDYAESNLFFDKPQAKGKEEQPVMVSFNDLELMSAADGDAKLIKIGVPEHMIPITKYIVYRLKQYRDPAPEHQWQKGFSNVRIVRAPVFSLNVFEAALKEANVPAEHIDRNHIEELCELINKEMKDRKETRLEVMFFNSALRVVPAISPLNDKQKEIIVNYLNRAISELKEYEKRFWVVWEKPREDGDGTETVLDIYVDKIPYLYTLSQDCLKYPGAPDGARIWRIDPANTAEPAKTLLDLVLDASLAPHEGGKHGHAMRVPVAQGSGDALAIPWDEIEDAQDREKMLMDFLVRIAKRDWPQIILDVFKGPHKWVPALNAIGNALKQKGQGPYLPGPRPITQSIIREVQANAGVFHESGIMGLAVGQWFFHVYCADDIGRIHANNNIDYYLATRCTFLDAKQRDEVKRWVVKINNAHRSLLGQKPQELNIVFDTDDGYLFGTKVPTNSGGLFANLTSRKIGTGMFSLLASIFTLKSIFGVPAAEAAVPGIVKAGFAGSGGSLLFAVGITLAIGVPLVIIVFSRRYLNSRRVSLALRAGIGGPVEYTAGNKYPLGTGWGDIIPANKDIISATAAAASAFVRKRGSMVTPPVDNGSGVGSRNTGVLIESSI